MNKKSGGKLGSSNIPVPTISQGHLSNANTGLKMTHSAEDIPKQIGTGLSVAASRGESFAGIRRAISPGEVRRKSMISPIRPLSQSSVPFQQIGVRYITEDLIQKITKETNLDLILSLNLTLSKEAGKKIKYIENLDRLRKLQTLNLSNNSIEKMERLDKLLRLQDLNLSNNKITKIEGIENLTALQTLNLNDNLVEHVPLWLSKKLKALRTFKIARNKINSLSEVAKLKSLPDLILLDLTGNHLVTLPHYRLYIIFHLRTVEILDNQTITDKERQLSLERFSNDEVEQLEKKLEEEELKYRQLKDSHSRSLHEKSIQETSQHQLEFKERNLQEQLKQLKQELSAKDELLKRKTSDLNKASQKHYHLKEAPNIHPESGDDSSDLQESPYIEWARFKPFHASPSKKDQTKNEIDKELEKKHTELHQTEEKLKVMQSELHNTEKMQRLTRENAESK
ncbi:hypothetical protein Btru_033787 [Bulinus truncatus]|nr:hypothetical protein Btru_033787 [Bulinus truncatus]